MANYKLKYKGAKIDELLGKVENMPSTVVDLVNDQTISGKKEFTSLIKAHTVSVNGYQDDDSYKYLALFSDGMLIGYQDRDLQEYFINLPLKSGTVALTSDLQNINLDNYVTLDGSQIITGEKKFD